MGTEDKVVSVLWSPLKVPLRTVQKFKNTIKDCVSHIFPYWWENIFVYTKSWDVYCLFTLKLNLGGWHKATILSINMSIQVLIVFIDKTMYVYTHITWHCNNELQLIPEKVPCCLPFLGAKSSPCQPWLSVLS